MEVKKTRLPGFAKQLKDNRSKVLYYQSEVDRLEKFAEEFNISTEDEDEENSDSVESVSRISPQPEISASWNSKVKPFSIPPSYKEAEGWREKTIFGLAQLEERTGYVPEILEKLKEYDPKMEIGKDSEAFKNVTRWASKLNRVGHIDFKKYGVRYKYSLKKEA